MKVETRRKDLKKQKKKDGKSACMCRYVHIYNYLYVICLLYC